MARFRPRNFASTTALAIALIQPRPAIAQTLPTGATVARGTVTIEAPSGGTLVVNQTSARAVVDWQGFDVGSGGTIRFQQADKASAILNRVGGSQGSQIDGRVESNGQVFLVNPNGIAIGSGGVIDTRGGFVASTLDIGDDDFMAGQLDLSGSNTSGAVRNAGNISSDDGFVALIGTSVTNSGTITANMGRVALGAATSATLDLSGDGFLQVALPAGASDAGGTPLIDQSGTIVVHGGRVRIKASVAADAVRRVVNLSGTIEANSLNGVNGDVLLQTVGGGDIVGDYRLDGPDWNPYTQATGASISAVDGSVRLDAAGSVRLTGTQINAATIEATAGGDIVGDYYTTSPALGPSTRIIGASLNAMDGSVRLGASGSIRLTGTQINTGTIDVIAAGDIEAATALIPNSGIEFVSPELNASRITTVFGAGAVTLEGVGFNKSGGGNRIDISGGSVVLDGVTADAPGGLIRVGGAFRDNAADDGSSAFQTFAGRFLQNGATSLPNLALADSVTVLTSGRYLSEFRAFGGAVTVASRDLTAVDGLSLPYGSTSLAISSKGAIPHFDYRHNLSSGYAVWRYIDDLFIGAPTISVRDQASGMDGATLVIDRNDLLDISASVSPSLTLEAGDALDVRDGLLLNNVNTSLRAGRSIVLQGAITQKDFGHLDIATNVADVNGGGQRGNGPALLDATAAQFTNLAGEYVDGLGDLSIRLLAGMDGGAGGLLKVGTIDRNPLDPGKAPAFGNFSLIAAPAAQIVFYGNVNTYFDQPQYVYRYFDEQSDFTLSGPLAFRNDATISAPAGKFHWLDRGVTPITTYADGRDNFLANYTFQTCANFSCEVLDVGAPVANASQLPQAGTITAGEAAFSVSDRTMTVSQTSDRAVIDWSSFNIGTGYTVSFAQPGSTSAILNRVSASTGVSTIAGTLSSNGQVFLVNPNGIVIAGNGAVSALGGFTASSLPLTNTAFMNGSLAWGANPNAAAISNAGTITAQNAAVTLLGGEIGNTGSIATDTGGTVELIASGTGSVEVGQVSGGALRLGARDIAIGYVAGADGLSMTPMAMLGLLAGFGSVAIEAGNDLAIRDDLSLNVPSLTNLSFAAGRNLSVIGQLQGGSTALSLTADSATAALGLAGARGSGAATLDLRVAVLGSSGTINLAVAGGSGVAGGLINLWSTTTAGGLSITAANGGATRFAGNVSAGGPLSLTGSLQFAENSIISAPNLSWSAAQSDTVTGFGEGAFNFAATAALVSGGTTLFRGTLGDRRAPRVALDGFTADRVSIVYGEEASLTGSSAIRLTSGNLLAGDTLASLFTPGSVVLGAVGSTRHDVGTHSLSLSTPNGPDAIVGKAGYFYDLRLPATGSFSITQRPITYALTDALSIYGTTAAITPGLSGVLSGDSVSGTVGAFSGITQVALADRLNAGHYTTRVTGLTGASAGNYLIAGNGNTRGSLTVAPLAISATATSATSIYGTAAVLGTPSLNGVLAGDQVQGIQALSIDGAITTPSDRLAVGSYAITVNGLTGASVSNYAVGTVTNALLSVDPKLLQLSLTSSSYTYGSPSAVAALTGVLSGDAVGLAGALNGVSTTLSGSPDALALSDRTAAGAYQLAVTGLTGAAAANYTLGGTATTSLTISPKQIALSLTPSSYTYGSPNAVAALSGVLSGDALGLAGTIDGTPTTLNGAPGALALPNQTAVGTRQLTVTGLSGSSSANYLIAPGSALTLALTITPRTITYRTSSSAVPYGDFGVTVSPSEGITLNGTLLGDDVFGVSAIDLGSGLVAVNSRTPVGQYLKHAFLSGGAAGNYILDASNSINGGFQRIFRRQITTSVADTQSVYGTLALLPVTLSNVLAGDDVQGVGVLLNEFGTRGFDNRLEVGNYNFRATGSLTGSDAANYLIVNFGSTGALTVTPKPISAILTGATYIYGAPATTVALDGIIDGDTVVPIASLDGNATAITADGSGYALDARVSAGTHAINVTGIIGARVKNYTLIGGPDATVTITPRPVTWSVADTSSIYGNLASPVAIFGNLLTGDSVTATFLVNGAAPVANARVGTYATSVGGFTGMNAGNYMLAATGNQTGQLTITPRPITYILGQQTSTYGNLATLGVSFANTLSGDTVTSAGTITVAQAGAAVTLADRSNAGTYQLGYTGGLAGADAANYTLTGGSAGSLTIGKRTISLTPDNISSVYGTLAIPTGTFAGVLSGDLLTPVFARYASGQAIPLTANLDANSYTIGSGGVAGPSVGNYQLDGVRTATLTVNPKTITQTIGNQSATYGSVSGTSSWAVGLTGVLAGDRNDVVSNATVVLGGASSTALLDAGNYTITAGALQGDKASNYLIVPGGSTSATLTVDPFRIGTLGSLTTNYGSLANIGGVSLTSTIAGLSVDRTLFLQGQTIDYRATTDVGTYRIGLSNLLLNGQPTSNYVIDAGRTASLTINPLTILAGSSVYVYTYGDVGSQVTVDTFGPNQFVAGDDARIVMNLGGDRSTSGLPVVGRYSGDAVLAGSRAFNYRLSTDNRTNVTILSRTVTGTLAGTLTRSYGDAGDLTGVLSGVLPGDAVSTNLIYFYGGGASGSANDARVAPQTWSASVQLAGADARNYDLFNSNIGRFTVTPRPVWFASAGLTQIYGSIGTPALANVLAGDGLTASSVLLNLDGNAYNSGLAAPVGQYKLNGSLSGGNSRANYVFQMPGGGTAADFTIIPRTLNFGGSTSLTFFDKATNTALKPLFGGLLAQDLTRIAPIYTGLNGSATINRDGRPDEGLYNLSLSSLGGTAGGNYVLGTNAASLRVNPLTIQWRLGASRTYGEAYAADTRDSNAVGERRGNRSGPAGTLIDIPIDFAGDMQLSGFLAGTNALITTRTAVGTYQLTAPVLTGASAHNFKLSAEPLSIAPLTVAQRSISFAGVAGSSQYAGLTTQPLITGITLRGILTGDDVQPITGLRDASGSIVTQFATGSYFSSATGLTGTQAGNYRLALGAEQAFDGTRSGTDFFPGGAPYAITPRILQHDAPFFTYGDSADLSAFLTATDLRVLAEDGLGLNFVLRNTSGGLATIPSLDAGFYSYALSITGGSAGNYLIQTGGAIQSGSLGIAPRRIGYTIAPVTNIYGESPAFGYSLTNTLAGRDTPLFALATSAASTTTIAASLANVGSYFARPIGLAGEKTANYNFVPTSDTTGATTVVRRDIAFSGTIQAVYGNAYVAGSDQFAGRSGTTGLVNGDAFTATATFATDPGRLSVGSYTYDGLRLDGAALGNYNVIVGGERELTITPKPLSIVWGTSNTYGDSNVLASFNNLLAGDQVTPGALVDCRIAGQCFTRDLTPVAQGNNLLFNRLNLAGTYHATLTGLSGRDAGNYTISGVSGAGAINFTIKPRPVTIDIIGTQTIYGDALPLYRINNLLPEDDTPGNAVLPSFSVSGDSAMFLRWANLGGYTPVAAGVRTGGATGQLLDVGTYDYTISRLQSPREASLARQAEVSEHAQSSGDQSAVLASYIAGSYTLTAPVTGTLEVSPRPYVVSFDTVNGSSRVYGNTNDVIGARGTIAAQAYPDWLVRSGTIPTGADVKLDLRLQGVDGSLSSFLTNDLTFTYPRLLDAGSYDVLIPGLTGAQARNFDLQFTTPAPTKLVVQPRPYVVTYDAANWIYNNIIDACDAAGKNCTAVPDTRPFVTRATTLVPGASGVSLGLDLTDSGTKVVSAYSFANISGQLSPQQDAGTYTISSRLIGVDARNYQLLFANNAPLQSLTIRPRPFRFKINLDKRYYGLLTESCNVQLECEMIQSPGSFYQREFVAPGTDVAINLSLTDQSLVRGLPFLKESTFGQENKYTSTAASFNYLDNTPAGTYRLTFGDGQGNGILTGAEAKNFYVPTELTKTRDFDIRPSNVGYRISGGGGAYIQGIGWVGGAGGGAELNGVLQSDQVSLIVGVYQPTTVYKEFNFGGTPSFLPEISNDKVAFRQGIFHESFEDIRDIAPYKPGYLICAVGVCYKDPGSITRETEVYLEVAALTADSRNYVLRAPGESWSRGAPVTVYPRSITDLPLAGIPSEVVPTTTRSALNIVQSAGARQASERTLADLALAATTRDRLMLETARSNLTSADYSSFYAIAAKEVDAANAAARAALKARQTQQMDDEFRLRYGLFKPYDEAQALSASIKAKYAQAFAEEAARLENELTYNGPGKISATVAKLADGEANKRTDQVTEAQRNAITLDIKKTLNERIAERIEDAKKELQAKYEGELNDQRTAESEFALGNANVLSSATNTSTATFSAGLAQVQMKLANSNEVSTLVTYGPGYTGAGASSSQELAFSTDLISANPSIKLSAAAEVSAYVMTGAAGSIDGLGDGKAEGRADVFAKASAEGNLEFKDGKLKLGQEFIAGAGASATATTSLSGTYGEASIGAGVYSPGTLAFGANVGAGFEGERLEISASVAIGIGLVGFKIDFKIAFDFGEVADVLRGAFTDLHLGLNHSQSTIDAAQAATKTIANWDVFNDPEGLLKVMERDPVAYKDAVDFYEGVTDVEDHVEAAKRMAAVRAEIKPQLDAQTALLTMLIKEPQKMTKADLDKMMQLKKDSAGLIDRYSEAMRPLGRKVVVQNGQMTAVLRD